jgi:hypothetical protein
MDEESRDPFFFERCEARKDMVNPSVCFRDEEEGRHWFGIVGILRRGMNKGRLLGVETSRREEEGVENI